MARTPKRLVGPALIATGPTTVYTVPASTKTIVRHIHIQNPTGSAVTYSLSIGADAVGTRLFQTFSIPAAAAGVTDSVRDHYWYQVMDAGEIMTVSAGTNNVLTITVSGDEITLG
jgi:hypothetical protein